MSIAAPIDAIDAGDLPWPDVLAHGVVAVHSYGFGHSAAACSCGWTGRRRYLKAAAEQEVRYLSPVGDPGRRGLSQPARIACSIGGSLLPPDRIITVRPGGVAPCR